MSTLTVVALVIIGGFILFKVVTPIVKKIIKYVLGISFSLVLLSILFILGMRFLSGFSYIVEKEGDNGEPSIAEKYENIGEWSENFQDFRDGNIENPALKKAYDWFDARVIVWQNKMKEKTQ